MKKISSLILLAIVPLAFACQKEDPANNVPEYVTETFESHPYLLLGKGGEANIKALVDSDPKMLTIHRKILAQANAARSASPTQYVTDSGGYLLETSRKALQNIFSLAYAWRLTGGEFYLTALEAELKSVCSFPKWDTVSYLGTAEMAMAVAIGYDWCYDVLSVETRSLVEKALTTFGLETCLTPSCYNQFRNSGGNWNSVCSAGLAYAAIALKDVQPEKSGKVLDLCSKSIKYAVDGYNPDGAYKEGPMYWAYGTEFQVMYNAAAEKLGMEAYSGSGEGFRKTPYFYLNAIAPSGKSFNFGDANSTVDFGIAQFYFAGLLKDQSLATWDLKYCRTTMADHRLLPAALIFAKDAKLSTTVQLPAGLCWAGNGSTPVFFARSAWGNSKASFVGVKGGQANISHQHMDGGTFVFDAGGVRWAQDFGNENYNKMESYLGHSGFWDMTQNSPRWKLTAYNNRAHNVMTINDRDFNVAGKASFNSTIEQEGRMGVKMNLTPLYYDMNLVTRQICLVGESLEIVDEVKPKIASDVLWTMNTDKNMEVNIVSDTEILLRNSAGRTLRMTFKVSGASLKAATWSITPGPNQSASGKGVGFKSTVAAGGDAIYTITMTNEN